MDNGGIGLLFTLFTTCATVRPDSEQLSSPLVHPISLPLIHQIAWFLNQSLPLSHILLPRPWYHPQPSSISHLKPLKSWPHLFGRKPSLLSSIYTLPHSSLLDHFAPFLFLYTHHLSLLWILFIDNHKTLHIIMGKLSKFWTSQDHKLAQFLVTCSWWKFTKGILEGGWIGFYAEIDFFLQMWDYLETKFDELMEFDWFERKH